MDAPALLEQSILERLTWMLLHFAWQGAAIAAAAWVVVRLFVGNEPQLRHTIYLASMCLMAAVPVVTFCVVDVERHAGNIAAADSVSPGTIPLVVAAHEPSEIFGESFAVHAGSDSSFDWKPIVQSWAPYCVVCWLTGVVLLGLRLLWGWRAVRLWKQARRPVPDCIAESARRLGSRLGLRGRVGVFGSIQVPDAVAVGLWRPLVLLPAAWLAEMPPSVLEAVIAHELSHIRRGDLWVNLFQRVVETILFYHPAVWWISGRLRAERELASDRLAAAALGQPVVYAEALEYVARTAVRSHQPLLATGLGDKRMTLLKRVKHVLGSEGREGRSGRWLAGLIVLAIPAALWMAAATFGPTVVADDSDSLLVAFDDDEEREVDRERRDGDREREGDRERDGDREREGDRPRGDREREGDRPRGEREGDRRDSPRDGDRPDVRRPPAREGDRPGFRRPPVRDGEGRPDGPQPPFRGEQGDLIRLIQQLRQEVEQLRREVNELRQQRGPDGRRGDFSPLRRVGPPERGDRPAPEGRRFDRPDVPRGEREVREREVIERRERREREGNIEDREREGDRERDDD